MIDIEAELFHRVVDEVRSKYDWGSSVTFYNDVPYAVQKFPCVTITERDNRTVEQSMDSSLTERHAVLDYEVNVYSNATSKRKAEAKAIMSAVDDVFIHLGFRRRILEALPEPEDWSIFRLLARYTCIVGEDKTIYRRP